MFDNLKINLTVANDATYFFNKMLLDNDIAILERKKSPVQLLAGLKKALNSLESTNDLLSAYAHLGALSLANSKAEIDALDHVDLSELQWGAELLAKIKRRYAPSQFMEFGSITRNSGTTSSSNSIRRIIIPSA